MLKKITLNLFSGDILVKSWRVLSINVTIMLILIQKSIKWHKSQKKIVDIFILNNIKKKELSNVVK